MKRYRFSGLWLVVLLAAGGVLAVIGCGSDSVTPKDELPGVTAESAARQAAYFAFYLAGSYDVWVGRHTKDTGVETFTEGNVSGSYTTDYRCGGSGGTPCAEDAPGTDFVRVWTAADQQVVVKDEEGATIVTATFDVDVSPYAFGPPEAGTLTGSGDLVAGAYTTHFALEGVLLNEDAYPPAGAVTYEAGVHDVMVQFDGTRFADLTVGSTSYLVDLDDGSLDPATR